MSAINEITTGLQSVIKELNEAQTAASATHARVEQATTQAAALCAANVVAGLGAVRDAIQSINQQIGATTEIARHAITHAKAVADGT